MRVVVVSPLPSEDNSVTHAFREQLNRDAVALGYSFEEHTGKAVAVSDNSVTVIYDRLQNSVLRDMWIGWQLSGMIKKIQPDIVIQLTGISLNASSFKQYHIVSPAFYNRTKINFRREKFAFANRRKIFDERNSFIVVSDTMREKLVRELEVSSKSIALASFTKHLNIIDFEETERIKQQTSGGSEFFFSDVRFVNEKEVVKLLKAFSVFKKWQQSSMHLVLQAKTSNQYDQVLATYKYRNDVSVTDTAESLPACYAAVQPFDDPGVDLITQASLVSIPAVTVPSDLLPVIQNEIFLSAEDNIDAIGQALLTLYKNEQRRTNTGLAANAYYTQLPAQGLLPILM